jgi:hypothetical protein
MSNRKTGNEIAKTSQKEDAKYPVEPAWALNPGTLSLLRMSLLRTAPALWFEDLVRGAILPYLIYFSICIFWDNSILVK